MIDKRMGTLKDLRALSDAAHARGMYVLVDVVVNHMANKFKYDQAFEGDTGGALAAVGAAPYRIHNGGYDWAAPLKSREYRRGTPLLLAWHLTANSASLNC